MASFIKEYINQFPGQLCDRLIQILENNITSGYAHAGLLGKDKSNTAKKDSIDLDLLTGTTDGVNQHLLNNFDTLLYEPATNYVNSYIISPKGQQDYLLEEHVRQAFVLLQPPKLKKYCSPDQGYHTWHQDYGPHPIQAKRIVVAMVYLNDVSEGGETCFFHQNLKIKPQKGKMVIFPPYFTHMHKGMPPKSNDKYICNFYLGFNPNM